MKKIFFVLLFILAITQNNYSQTLHDSKRKKTKMKNFYKVQIDSCSNIPGIVIDQACDDMRKKTEPQMPGPLYFYPTPDEMNKWMLIWSRAIKGIQIVY